MWFCMWIIRLCVDVSYGNEVCDHLLVLYEKLLMFYTSSQKLLNQTIRFDHKRPDRIWGYRHDLRIHNCANDHLRILEILKKLKVFWEIDFFFVKKNSIKKVCWFDSCFMGKITKMFIFDGVCMNFTFFFKDYNNMNIIYEWCEHNCWNENIFRVS